jgi:hypothetical protein
MNYTGKPFDLETALKHPEWVYFRKKGKPDFWRNYPSDRQAYSITAIDCDGICYKLLQEGLGNPIRENDYDLILRVPERTVWVNIYPNGLSYYYDTKKEADNVCFSNRIACVEVKIPCHE